MLRVKQYQYQYPFPFTIYHSTKRRILVVAKVKANLTRQRIISFDSIPQFSSTCLDQNDFPLPLRSHFFPELLHQQTVHLTNHMRPILPFRFPIPMMGTFMQGNSFLFQISRDEGQEIQRMRLHASSPSSIYFPPFARLAK